MGECKKDVTLLLTHWSYIFLALTHRYDDVDWLYFSAYSTVTASQHLTYLSHFLNFFSNSKQVYSQEMYIHINITNQVFFTNLCPYMSSVMISNWFLSLPGSNIRFTLKLVSLRPACLHWKPTCICTMYPILIASWSLSFSGSLHEIQVKMRK